MPHLAIDVLQPGMTLTEAVLNDGGGMLLPAGTVLTAAHIDSLRRRRIETVNAQAPTSPEARMHIRHAETERVEKLFRRAGEDPLMHALREALLAYRLGRIE